MKNFRSGERKLIFLLSFSSSSFFFLLICLNLIKFERKWREKVKSPIVLHVIAQLYRKQLDDDDLERGYNATFIIRNYVLTDLKRI